MTVGKLSKTSYRFILLHSIYFPSSVSYPAGYRMAPHIHVWVLYLREVLDPKSYLIQVYSALFGEWCLAALPQALCFNFTFLPHFFLLNLSTVTDPRMIHTVCHRELPWGLSGCSVLIIGLALESKEWSSPWLQSLSPYMLLSHSSGDTIHFLICTVSGW